MTTQTWRADEIFVENAPNRAVVRILAWGGPTVADCGEATPESLARARLMAAAPEMAKALKDLLTPSVEASPQGWHAAKTAARSALRKAGLHL